ncbi:unnamed protein product [Psylliodes chrysocephalus]|uniref:HAT C-terminal dimerisation domain-containing protein n=1 Tax=Psylliodes chrysocephalus TaxID=3402493 RepID=A0A9P0GDC6_9CUCU|nr:unnamed protein product [Psylliodes chrysocephala]
MQTDKSANEKATYNICKRTTSLGGRGRHANTSNLKSHLEKYHDEEFRNVTRKDTKEQISHIKNIIKRQHTAAEVDPESLEDEDNIPLSHLQNKQNTFWETFYSIASTSASETSTTKYMKQGSENEIILYLESSTLLKDKSSFEWWEAEKNKFPSLYNAASVYLSAPAGSVSSEQLFSELELEMDRDPEGVEGEEDEIAVETVTQGMEKQGEGTRGGGEGIEQDDEEYDSDDIEWFNV